MRNPSNWALSLAAWSARNLPQPIISSLYRLRPLADLVRGFLNRSAPKGFAPVTIAAGELEGFQFILDLQEEKDYWLGTYEPQLQAAILDLATDRMTAYDVGANIGYISILLAKAVGDSGAVYAFEALPNNLDRLQQNLAINNLEQQVTVVSGAVVEAEGTLQFFTGPSGSTGKVEGSAGRKPAQMEAIEVQGLSLDEFVYQDGYPAPDIVKIDIEGGEVQALPGMRRLLQEVGPIMMIELHGPESAEAAGRILGDCGYRLCRMEPGYPPAADPDRFDWKTYVVALK